MNIMDRLFIIGNGFDVQHGFNTKYCFFKEWLEKKIMDNNNYINAEISPNIFFDCYDNDNGYNEKIAFVKSLCDQFNSSSDWHSFENDLAYIDVVSKLRNNCNMILNENDMFDNPNRYEDVFGLNSELLKETIEWIPLCFNDWIETVDISSPKGKVKVSKEFSDSSLFLNFNYTETLEEIYGIQKNNICYIHGRRHKLIPLIIGHSGSYLESEGDVNTYNYVETELRNYCVEKMKKPTSSIIALNKMFFDRVNEDIKDIYSYGFSFSKVDLPYIQKVIKNIGCNTVWHLSNYDDSKKIEEITGILRGLGFVGQVDIFDSGLIEEYNLF